MDQITYLDPKVTELIRSDYVAVRVDEDSLSRLVEFAAWGASFRVKLDEGFSGSRFVSLVRPLVAVRPDTT